MQSEYWELTDPQDQHYMKYIVTDCCMEYLLISGSNQAKYGTLTKGFLSHYYLGSDQYPSSITTAANALSNHKIDPWYFDNQNHNRDKSRSNHKNRETDNEGNPTSFSQK